MSRIGNKLIEIPEDVSLNIDQNSLTVTGSYGTLKKEFLNLISFETVEKKLRISRINETKQAKAYHGLARSLVDNMIIGTKFKITKILVTEGIGYKFQLDTKELTLLIGFSHPIKIAIPKNIFLQLESPTRLIISGIDIEEVTLFASKIYNLKRPEPYKGRGILYDGQIVLRKPGKTKK